MMQWAGHVVHIGKLRNVFDVLEGSSVAKTPFERPRFRRQENFRIYLQQVVILLTGSIWLRRETNSGLLGKYNEILSSTNVWEYLERLSYFH